MGLIAAHLEFQWVKRIAKFNFNFANTQSHFPLRLEKIQ